ncbi:MAG: hypothetical protein WCT45_01010 [Candidatus Paceibacterota bacterium]
MTKNPFVNALVASAYITVFVSVMSYTPKMHIPENGIIIPIGMLSLFVLSAAVMGYLFIYQPAQLFFEGKQGESVRFFLSTVASFVAITALVLAACLLFV